MKNRIEARLSAAAGVVTARGVKEGVTFRNTYHFECFDKNGDLKWTETVENMVVNQGLNDVLDKYFKGSTYTATWFVGLVDNTNFGDSPPAEILAGDTAAKIVTLGNANPPTSNEWEESTVYANSNRPTLTLGSVSGQSVDNSGSVAAFSINASATVNGAFVISNNTKGGTTGILYGAASFVTPRVVEDGDTLNVTITLTAATA